MKNKRVYVVLTHTASKNNETNWKWQTLEKCEFMNSLKNRHYDTASAILDLTNEQIVKCRVNDAEYSDLLEYVAVRYESQLETLFAENFPDRTLPVGKVLEDETSTTEDTTVDSTTNVDLPGTGGSTVESV